LQRAVEIHLIFSISLHPQRLDNLHFVTVIVRWAHEEARGHYFALLELLPNTRMLTSHVISEMGGFGGRLLDVFFEVEARGVQEPE
jgi:hypothetical protein